MKLTSNICLLTLALAFSSCEKFLDRPPLTVETDATAWSSEEKLRLYANKYYTDFFPGYSGSSAPIANATNTDDIVTQGLQENFMRAVPTTSIWNYDNVRSINIMIDRIDSKMSTVLTAEAKAHWMGIGRFFRAFRYFQLVKSFGDVPYYDREVFDNELNELFKDRNSRQEVMDAVLEDLKFALENVRANDGEQNVNRYVVAAFASRIALHEGTWQKYYYKNSSSATKFLNFSVEAADVVINSGRYDITSDYRSLFTSLKLAGNKEMILYKNYDAAVAITHSVASYNNLQESTLKGPSSNLLKAYLCVDGKVSQVSDVENASSFELENLIKTRDSRLEASIYSKPDLLNKGSLYYIVKYFPRDMEKKVKVNNETLPTEFTGNKNETDAPIIRYAEVLLNWIEAKAELASMSGAAVSQAEIDKSINKIRSRPLAADAVTRGVQKTSALDLATIANDPSRDPSVSPLLWEIRRERRMEFAFESNRLDDLRRWSKLEYMDTDLHPDLLSGGWVNFPAQLPGELAAKNVGLLSVIDAAGKQLIFTGNNGASMKGFYKSTSNKGRLSFLNQPNINPYLTPVGFNEINEYKVRGFVLKQTEGWPQN